MFGRRVGIGLVFVALAVVGVGTAVAQDDLPLQFTGPNAGPLRALFELSLATSAGVSRTEAQLVELTTQVQEVSEVSAATQESVATIAAFGAIEIEASCAEPGFQQARTEVATVRLCPGDSGDCVTINTPCYPWGCDDGACNTICSTNADCAAGAECDQVARSCVPVINTCSDGYTVRQANGAEVSCGGYRCVAGACQQQCRTNLDCQTDQGFSCQNNHCVK